MNGGDPTGARGEANSDPISTTTSLRQMGLPGFDQGEDLLPNDFNLSMGPIGNEPESTVQYVRIISNGDRREPR